MDDKYREENELGREYWRFIRSVEDVLAQAQEKHDYHTSRVEYWKDEQTKAMEEARENGLEIKAHEITGGVRAGLEVNPSLLERINEAENKLRIHRDKVREYDMWIGILDTEEPTRKLTLTTEDLRFFFAEPNVERTANLV